MKKIITAIALVSVLTGCATTSSPLPEGYKGSTAIIKDSVISLGPKKAEFFYVSHVDGKRIDDSRIKTLQVNQGRGMTMTPELIARPVAAKLSTFTIVGRTEYAAPILALTNDVYEVKGEIQFAPEENKTYAVHGELGENYSAVWVEDEAEHKVIVKKIEINGSAKLGLFQK
jgi:hypothetical protein